MKKNLSASIEKNCNRPQWDEIWMTFAKSIAKRSCDSKYQVGAVIVNGENTQVLSIGYNGDQKGGSNQRDSTVTGQSGFIHAEINSITDAAKRGVSVDGATAYITHYPCLNCYKALCSSGIKKIYYKINYKNDPNIEELGYNVTLSRL